MQVKVKSLNGRIKIPSNDIGPTIKDVVATLPNDARRLFLKITSAIKEEPDSIKRNEEYIDELEELEADHNRELDEDDLPHPIKILFHEDWRSSPYNVVVVKGRINDDELKEVGNISFDYWKPGRDGFSGSCSFIVSRHGHYYEDGTSLHVLDVLPDVTQDGRINLAKVLQN